MTIINAIRWGPSEREIEGERGLGEAFSQINQYGNVL